MLKLAWILENSLICSKMTTFYPIDTTEVYYDGHSDNTEYGSSNDYGATGTTGFNNATGLYSPIAIEVDIYDCLQIILLCIGIIGNILILVVLNKNKGHLQPVTLTLVKHQSVIDALVCVTLIAHLVIPRYWNSGIFALDSILCFLFHSEGK